MDIVLILVGLALVAVIAFLVLRRGGEEPGAPEAGGEPGERSAANRSVEPMEPGAPAAATERPRPPSAGAAPPRSSGVAEPEREPGAPRTQDEPGARPGPGPATPVAEPEPRPALDPEAVKAKVDEILRDSDRMLGELRDAASEGSVAAGSVEVLGEGLDEVRRLAEKKSWEQAKTKGEALRAQLSLMLQNARREGST